MNDSTLRLRARRLARAALALLFYCAGCDFESLDEASCPPDGTALTYEDFGEPFLDAHCNGCHSAVSGERRGAPGKYVFATHDDVLTHRERIYARSAGANDTMPPGPDDPPLEEREKLAEWLACGAP